MAYNEGSFYAFFHLKVFKLMVIIMFKLLFNGLHTIIFLNKGWVGA